MQLVTEMTLPHLPVESPEFHKDPFRFTENARKAHPWLAKFSQGYIVHGYQAVKDLAMRDDVLRPGLFGLVEFYEVQGTPWARFMKEMLISSSGAEHKRLRDSVASGFTPRRANETRGLMRQVVTELLDKWAPKGAFDFAEFAANFPIAVMCGLLGVSSDSIPKIRRALDDHMASLSFDPATKAGFLAAYDVLWNFADTVIVEREKRGPGDDSSELDAMIAAKRAGKMDETELRFMLMTFLLAGYDTSKNMLGMIMYKMLEEREAWARCAEDKAYCAKVVEEMLRYSSIATSPRQVAKEFEYDDVRFPAGAILSFAFPLSGRDPAAFHDPDKFDPERVHSNRHAAFGRGVHICIGQFIARNQLEEGLHLIAQRLTRPRLAGEVTWRPFLGAWGLQTLPIEFDPAPAGGASPLGEEDGVPAERRSVQ